MQPGQTQPQWKFTASQSRLLTRAVAEVLVRDGHHISMVEGDGFRKLLRIVEPRFVLPSRTFFAQVIVLVPLFRAALHSAASYFVLSYHLL